MPKRNCQGLKTLSYIYGNNFSFCNSAHKTSIAVCSNNCRTLNSKHKIVALVLRNLTQVGRARPAHCSCAVIPDERH